MKENVDKICVVIRIYRISRWCYKHHLTILSRLFYAVNYILFSCVIPPSAELGDNVNIAHGIGIVIHHKAVIGENTKIYQNVTIGGGTRYIGRDCYIGTGAVVLADIGDNVKIGANAVVTKNRYHLVKQRLEYRQGL